VVSSGDQKRHLVPWINKQSIRAECGNSISVDTREFLKEPEAFVSHVAAMIFLIQRGEPFITPAGLSGKMQILSNGRICLALSGAARWSLDAWLFGSQHNYRRCQRAGAR
jgi:hypothetical protein